VRPSGCCRSDPSERCLGGSDCAPAVTCYATARHRQGVGCSVVIIGHASTPDPGHGKEVIQHSEHAQHFDQHKRVMQVDAMQLLAVPSKRVASPSKMGRL
jgi:hypothetical protein